MGAPMRRTWRFAGYLLVTGIAAASLIAFAPGHSLSLPMFQSELPPPPNPHFIAAASGGRIYCGAIGGTVWLDLPQGFTPDGGAEVHCDPTDSLMQWNHTSRAWDDRGYLINLYPQIRLVQPLSLIFELDPTRTGNICPTCFLARYYQPEGALWKPLLTAYNPSTGRVSVEISGYLPPSGYPGYADRFLIALFILPPTPPPPAPTRTPSPTSTRPPAPTPTSTPSPTSTQPPAPTPTSTPSPTSTRSPVPSRTPEWTAIPTSIASVEPEQPSTSSEKQNHTSRLLMNLLWIFGLIILLLTTWVIVLLKRQHQNPPHR
jgi:hypothetical protein